MLLFNSRFSACGCQPVCGHGYPGLNAKVVNARFRGINALVPSKARARARIPAGNCHLSLHFSQSARLPRTQALAKFLRAGRPSGQPVRRPALQVSDPCEKCGLETGCVCPGRLIDRGHPSITVETCSRAASPSSASTLPALRHPCPIRQIDNFAMRNFTNDPVFDDTLPAGRWPARSRSPRPARPPANGHGRLVSPQRLPQARGAARSAEIRSARRRRPDLRPRSCPALPSQS